MKEFLKPTFSKVMNTIGIVVLVFFLSAIGSVVCSVAPPIGCVILLKPIGMLLMAPLYMGWIFGADLHPESFSGMAVQVIWAYILACMVIQLLKRLRYKKAVEI